MKHVYNLQKAINTNNKRIEDLHAKGDRLINEANDPEKQTQDADWFESSSQSGGRRKKSRKSNKRTKRRRKGGMYGTSSTQHRRPHKYPRDEKSGCWSKDFHIVDDYLPSHIRRHRDSIMSSVSEEDSPYLSYSSYYSTPSVHSSDSEIKKYCPMYLREAMGKIVAAERKGLKNIKQSLKNREKKEKNQGKREKHKKRRKTKKKSSK